MSNTPKTEVLLSIARGLFKLGRDQHGRAFVTTPGRPHLALLIEQNEALIKHLLRLNFHRQERKVLASEGPLDAVLRHLEAEAQMEEPTPVFVRIGGEYDEKGLAVIWVDLGTDKFVRIEPGQWSIVDETPLTFARTVTSVPFDLDGSGFSAADDPSIFLGTPSAINPTEAFKAQWPVVAGWLIAAYFPGIQIPGLAFVGTYGSAKTETQRAIQKLVDPQIVDVVKMPKDSQGMTALRLGAYLINFDNVGRTVKDEISDTFSGMVTGQAAAERRYYTNGGLFLAPRTHNRYTFSMAELSDGWQPDALERMVIVRLHRVTENKRLSEVHAVFDQHRNFFLFSLFQAVAETLEVLRSDDFVEPDPVNLPRMADFSYVLAAHDQAHGTDSYQKYLDALHGMETDILAAAPLASVLFKFMRDRDEWVGSMTELLNRLNDIDMAAVGTLQASVLGQQLGRLDRSLRAVGLQITRGRGHGGRTVTISKTSAFDANFEEVVNS